MGWYNHRMSAASPTTHRVVSCLRWAAGIALATWPLACQSSAPAQPEPNAASSLRAPDETLDAELVELAKTMVGRFSSRAQSLSDEDFFAIQMILVPIWGDRTDGHWLYVEQATEARPEAPYRQRVYQVTREDGRLVSHVYELPGDPKDFAGSHAQPESFDRIGPKSLTLRTGCSVFLERTGPQAFSGGTEGTGCTSDWGDADYVTSEVHVDENGIRSWDRGYAASGEQAWGAVSGPYVFDRQ